MSKRKLKALSTEELQREIERRGRVNKATPMEKWIYEYFKSAGRRATFQDFLEAYDAEHEKNHGEDS